MINTICLDYTYMWLSDEFDIEMRKIKISQDLIIKIINEELRLKLLNNNMDEYEIKKKASNKINKIILKELKTIQQEEYKLLYS